MITVVSSVMSLKVLVEFPYTNLTISFPKVIAFPPKSLALAAQVG